MDLYVAGRIEKGKISYAKFFAIAMYAELKVDVAAILIADGHQDLIVI